MKIAAIVITYNRLELLKKTIESLKNQTKQLDKIIVVNNGSTDGTDAWLNEERDLHIITQTNSGSSGGQFTGIKTAFDKGYDWIWCMDDDIILHKECLAELMNVAENEFKNNFRVFLPDRKMLDKEINWRYGTNFNFTNPFKKESTTHVSAKEIEGDFIQIKSIPFEGPLIHRSVIEKIGNVNKDIFINFDDTDYSIRMHLANIKVALVKRAILYRMISNNDGRLGWKDYYYFRNSIYIDKTYGSNIFMIFRLMMNILKLLRRIIKNLFHGDIYNIRFAYMGIKDGFKDKLGKLSS